MRACHDRQMSSGGLQIWLLTNPSDSLLSAVVAMLFALNTVEAWGLFPAPLDNLLAFLGSGRRGFAGAGAPHPPGFEAVKLSNFTNV